MTISPDRRQRLVVMVKEPRAGRVKTRLGKEIGMTAAAWWFRHQTTRLLRHVQDPRWQTILAASPDHAGLHSRVWPEHFDRMPQGQGDLGQRMARIFHRLPPGPSIIIGADIPAIRRHHIACAFQELGRHQAVFGPSTDGGYWLVGLKRTAGQKKGLFRNVRWSSRHALQDTLQSFGDLSVGYAATLADIDTAADLKQAFSPRR